MSAKIINARAFGVLLAAFGASSAAQAQPLGSRSAGMSEAFVAVADDASSIYWNPAGMATGAYTSFVIDFGAGEGRPESAGSPHGASEADAQVLAFTLPPLGLGYYRRHDLMAAPAEKIGVGRQDGGRSVVRGLTTSTVAVAVAQSLGEFLVVAATAKLMRGEVESGLVAAGTAEEALDSPGLSRKGSSAFDVDAGAMLTLDQWRVGMVARNLTTPSFQAPDPETAPMTLERQVRAGVAWGSGWPGTSRVVLAGDLDVTRRSTPSGDRRDVALGVESWWLGQRLGVRGGVRGSTEGEARPVVAAGVSAAVRSGVFVEGHVARGRQDERSWSVGGRLTF